MNEILQKICLKLAGQYGTLVALEDIEVELKKISKTYKISEFIDNIVYNMDTRFRIELLMFPDWATKNKMYKIKNDYYTHVRIKRSLI